MRTPILAFAVSAAFTVAVMQPRPADATTQYYNMEICYLENGVPLTWTSDGQMGNNSQQNSSTLECPIVGTGTAPTAVTLYGYTNSSTYVSYNACRTFAGGSGGACNTTATLESDINGTFAASLGGLTTFSNTDFNWISVTAGAAGLGATMFGYKVVD